MAEISTGRKIIAVSMDGGRERYLLQKILGNSGRNGVFTIVPVDEAMERGLKASLLFAPVLPVCTEPKLFPVCVTKFRPELQKPEGFRSVITYSTEWNVADFTARNIRQLPGGASAFEIVGVGIIGRVRLGPGCGGDVEASLAAAAAATTAGVPFAEALAALNAPEQT
jgi:hypothetical protein